MFSCERSYTVSPVIDDIHQSGPLTVGAVNKIHQPDLPIHPEKSINVYLNNSLHLLTEVIQAWSTQFSQIQSKIWIVFPCFWNTSIYHQAGFNRRQQLANFAGYSPNNHCQLSIMNFIWVITVVTVSIFSTVFDARMPEMAFPGLFHNFMGEDAPQLPRGWGLMGPEVLVNHLF